MQIRKRRLLATACHAQTAERTQQHQTGGRQGYGSDTDTDIVVRRTSIPEDLQTERLA